MPSYEGLRLRIQKTKRNMFSKYYLRELKNRNFTILSNNCWGGIVYESYGLQKLSPTVGMFFMASDYIRFLRRIDYYFNKKLDFITLQESKWKEEKQFSKGIDYPIAKLDDIELFFMHYHTKEEARNKWERRIQRINRENIVIKFNDQNACTSNDVEAFCNLPFENKLFFTAKEWGNSATRSDTVNCHFYRFKQPRFYNTIMASYEPVWHNRQFDVTEYLNSIM